jgi:DNA-binding transcriptional regulator YbjK
MAHQMKHQNEQQKLKALVRELERELSQGNMQIQALGETQERLQEADRICHELIDENRQLREQITDWQKRLAATEDYQREIGMLKQHSMRYRSNMTRYFRAIVGWKST